MRKSCDRMASEEASVRTVLLRSNMSLQASACAGLNECSSPLSESSENDIIDAKQFRPSMTSSSLVFLI